MTLTPTPLVAGIYTDITTFAAKDNYVFADKVRFRQGFPESIGGCLKYNASITFDGVPRHQKQWAQLDGTFTIATGTHKKIELLIAATKYDVTPYEFIVTGSLTDKFTTTSTSADVSVNHVAHGRAVGDVIMFPNAVALDGVDIGKFSWEVKTITDADNYIFTSADVATGSTSGGGGTVTYYYNSKIMANNPLTTTSGSATVVVTDVAHGLSTGATVTIIGAANFNSVTANGTWPIVKITADSYSFTYTGLATGTGGGGGAACRIFRCLDIGAPSGASMRLPCLQNWGEDLLFTNGANSRVYLWDVTLGTTKRARAVPRAPTCDFIMVSTDDQSLVALGTDGDNMNIDWSTESDYTIWIPAATNTAGDKRLLRGSRLVGAIPVTGGSLVFTDIAVHLMTFTGGEFVFSITFIGKTKLVGQNAVCEKDGIGYWIGNKNFYTYDGRSRSITCTVNRRIFDDFNTTEQQGCVAGINDGFGEFWAFYPSSTATYNDSYAIWAFNETEQPWSIGDWERLTWMDDEIYTYPLACDSAGNMYKHEFGLTNDGVSLDAEVHTGDIQPGGDGEYFYLGKRVVLDFKMTGNIYVTVRTRSTEQDDYSYGGPILIGVGDGQMWTRWRGRRMGYIIATPTQTLEALETEDLMDLLLTEDGEILLADGVIADQTLNLATSWRMGIQSPDIKQDGKR